MSKIEIDSGNIVKRFAFWNPATWSIPKLYWDAWSQEQRLHAICKQLEKVIAYADYLGVNVDDIASRLKAIEDGQLDELITEKIEEWFEENEPQIAAFIAELETTLTDRENPFEIVTGRDNNSNSVYTILKWHKSKVDLSLAYRDLDYPTMQAADYIKTLDNQTYAANCALKGVFVQAGNPVDLEADANSQYCYILGFDDEGNAMYTPDIYRELNALDLIEEGFYNAFGVFSPICINSIEYDRGLLPDDDPNVDFEALYDHFHTRSIFGWDLLGNYYYAAVEGRLTMSYGMNFTQMYEFCINHGITTAFNLDGGGSTQLWTCGNMPMNFVYPDSTSTVQYQNSRNVFALLMATAKEVEA